MLISENHLNYIPMHASLGLAAVLYQNSGWDWLHHRQVGPLSKTKHKYLAHKLEFLALKWAVME